jgi:tellurite resistance protein
MEPEESEDESTDEDDLPIITVLLQSIVATVVMLLEESSSSDEEETRRAESFCRRQMELLESPSHAVGQTIQKSFAKTPCPFDCSLQWDPK